MSDEVCQNGHVIDNGKLNCQRCGATSEQAPAPAAEVTAPAKKAKKPAAKKAAKAKAPKKAKK